MVHMHKIQAAWEATVTTLHIDGVWGAKRRWGCRDTCLSFKEARGLWYNQLQQGFSKSLSYLKQAQVRPWAQKNAIKWFEKSRGIFRMLWPHGQKINNENALGFFFNRTLFFTFCVRLMVKHVSEFFGPLFITSNRLEIKAPNI